MRTFLRNSNKVGRCNAFNHYYKSEITDSVEKYFKKIKR